MLDPVTVRYTEALFNLARSQGALDDVGRDVERLSEEFAKPAVKAFFLDERVSVEGRRTRMGPLTTGMHRLTKNFVNLLFDKRREVVLAGLGAAFHRRLLQEAGAAEGVVQSARPLGQDDVARLEDALGRRLAKRVKLQNEVHSDLVGGLRVIVESRMIDYSFAGRLEGLRKRLLAAPLPALAEA